VRVVLLLTIPAAALTQQLTFGWLCVVLALLGILGLLFETAYRAYLPSLVPPHQLVASNSRLSTTDSLAEIGGPAIAGVLIQLVTAPFAIILDALTFVVSAATFSRIRAPEPTPQPRAIDTSVRREIAEGLRLVAADPLLRVLIVTLGVSSFFGSFYGTLYDIFGIRVLGLSPAILGITIAAGGVGALAGALLANRIQARFGLGRTLVASMLLAAPFSALIPLAGYLPDGSPILAATLLIITQIVSDGAMTVYAINSISLVQMRAPNHMLGRANASFGFIGQGVAPFGALLAGALATSIGARSTLLVAVIGGFVLALWFSRSAVRAISGFAAPVPDPPV
jgi:predicted MFS family arabinose efflux permease